MVYVKTGVSIKTQNLGVVTFFIDNKTLKTGWSQNGLNLVSNEKQLFCDHLEQKPYLA